MPGASVFIDAELLLPPPRSQEDDDRDRRDDGKGHEAGTADPSLERVPAVGEGIADEAERDRPGDGSRGVPEEKARPRQIAGARQQRPEHAQARDEPRDEDRARAVP